APLDCGSALASPVHHFVHFAIPSNGSAQRLHSAFCILPSSLLPALCGFRAFPISQGCIKLLDFSLSSIGWRRGLGRGGAFLLVSPLLGPLPTRFSRGVDGALDAALPLTLLNIFSSSRRTTAVSIQRVRIYL